MRPNSPPDHQRVLEQAALLEILDQGRRRLVDRLGHDPDVLGQVAVLIPALVVQLDESHVALGEPPRQQAVGRIAARCLDLGTVHVEDALRLVRKVHDLRHRRLHAVRHLVLGDARVDLGIEHTRVLFLLELPERVEHVTARIGAQAVGVAEVEHRVLAAAELHALVLRGQEAAPPEPRVERLVALAGPRQQHDECRQVGVVRPEPVREPGPDRGTAGLLRSRLHERHGGVVIDRLGVHRLDEAQLVGDRADVRQQFADGRAALAVARHREVRSGKRELLLVRRHAGQALPHPDGRRQVLAVHRPQQRLVIEQVEL